MISAGVEDDGGWTPFRSQDVSEKKRVLEPCTDSFNEKDCFVDNAISPPPAAHDRTDSPGGIKRTKLQKVPSKGGVCSCEAGVEDNISYKNNNISNTNSIIQGLEVVVPSPPPCLKGPTMRIEVSYNAENGEHKCLVFRSDRRAPLAKLIWTNENELTAHVKSVFVHESMRGEIGSRGNWSEYVCGCKLWREL